MTLEFWYGGNSPHHFNFAETGGLVIGRIEGETQEQAGARAARIVACVNFCEGVPIEILTNNHINNLISGWRCKAEAAETHEENLRTELEQVKAAAQSFGEQFARLKVERQNLKDAVGEIGAELLADDPFDQLGERLAALAKGETPVS